MGLFETLIEERKAKRTAQKQEAARVGKLQAKRLDYLATPGKLEGDVANLAEYYSPSKAKIRTTKHSKAEALRRREEGGPLEGFQESVATRFQGLLRDDANLEVSPERLLAHAGQQSMTKEGYLQALYKHKMQADTGLGRLFGVLGPDESVKKPPGYDEFKLTEEVKQDRATKNEYMHPAKSALIGAGGYVALEMAKRVFKKKALSAAATALIPLPGARPVALAKIAMAAATAIPEFFAFDVGQNLIKNSRWAKARQVKGKLDTADIAEFGLGALLAGGVGIPARAVWKKLEGKFGNALKEKMRHEAEHGVSERALVPVSERGFTMHEPYPSSPYPLGSGGYPSSPYPGVRDYPVIIRPGDSAAKVLSADRAAKAGDEFAESFRKTLNITEYDVIEETLAKNRSMLRLPEPERALTVYEPKVKTIAELVGEDYQVFKPQTDTWINRKFNQMTPAESDYAIMIANQKGTSLRQQIFEYARLKDTEEVLRTVEYYRGNNNLDALIPSKTAVKKAAVPKITKKRAASKVKKVKATKKVKETNKKVVEKIEKTVATAEKESQLGSIETPLVDMFGKGAAGKVEGKLSQDPKFVEAVGNIIQARLKPGASSSEALGIKSVQLIASKLGVSEQGRLAATDLVQSIVRDVETAKAGGTSVPSTAGILRDWLKNWSGRITGISLGTAGLALTGVVSPEYAEASDEETQIWRVQQLSEDTELSRLGTERLTSQGEDIADNEAFKSFGQAVLDVGSVALSTLAEFVGPAEVEAAMISTIAKTFVPAVKEVASKSKKAVTKIIQDLHEAGYVHTPLPEGAKSVEHIVESLHSAPDIVEQVGSLKEALTGRKVPLINWLMSPFGQAQVLYKSYSEKVGDKLQTYFMSPIPDLGSGQHARIHRIRDHLEATGNILRDVGLPKKRTKHILKAMKPLAQRHKETEIAYSAAKMLEEHLSGKLERIAKSLTKKKRGGALQKVRREETRVLELIEKTRNAIADLAPKHEAYLQEWKQTVMEVAKKEPSTRIALMVEDAHIHEGLADLPGLLTEPERQAVVYLKDMMNQYAKRFENIGEKTITNRAYIHHAWHPEWTKSAAEKRLLSYGIKSDAVPFSKLFHRSKYSKQMAPDINYIMQKYIFDSERRIQMLEFWDKNKVFSKDTWYSHYQWVKEHGSKELKAFWDNINRSFAPPPESRWNTLANRYAAIEVLRLIAFAPSTAFKHYFKNIGTASALGVGEFLKNVPASFVQAGRILANDVSRAVAPALGLKAPQQLKRLEDQLAKSFIGTSKGVNVFAGLDLEPAIRNTVGFWSAFDRQLAKVNKAGGSLIGLVETVDRTHTLRAALDIAANKGMTAKQALYSYWSNILEMNFLSGELNPSWVRNPKARALLLFQNTAYKIFERRILTTINAGRDVMAAGKAFKGRSAKEMLGDLHSVGRWMVGLEKDLKKNLIVENLTSSKDIFGVPYIQRAMREAVMSGIVLGGGAAMGLNLFPQVVHVPFLAHGASEPTLAANPLVHALFRTTMGAEQGGRDITDEDFWFAEFMKEWLRGSGYMNQTANKIVRTVKGDIPALYEGDTGSPFPKELLYLLSVPRKKEAME